MMATVNRGVGRDVAKMAGESPVMDMTADKIADLARAGAGQHRETGAFAASIKTTRTPGKHGVTDRLVYSDDPAAAPIEFGHMTRRGKTGQPRWVPGLFILHNAAKQV